MRLRRAELAFLEDLQQLDDIRLGMLAPRRQTEDLMERDGVTTARLVLVGYIRQEPNPGPGAPHGCTFYLTTAGKRALQRRLIDAA